MAIWPKQPPRHDDARYPQLRLVNGRKMKQPGYVVLAERPKIHRAMLNLYFLKGNLFYHQIGAESLKIIHAALNSEGVFRNFLSNFLWYNPETFDSNDSDASTVLEDDAVSKTSSTDKEEKPELEQGHIQLAPDKDFPVLAQDPLAEENALLTTGPESNVNTVVSTFALPMTFSLLGMMAKRVRHDTNNADAGSRQIAVELVNELSRLFDCSEKMDEDTFNGTLSSISQLGTKILGVESATSE